MAQNSPPTPVLGGTEYRITWRRAGWSARTSTKSRTFRRKRDARALYDKLNGGDRPDLSGLAILRVAVREVGPWRVVR